MPSSSSRGRGTASPRHHGRSRPPGLGTAKPRNNWALNHKRGLNHGLKWATTALELAESAVLSAHPQERRTLVEELKRCIENKSWQEYKKMRFEVWDDVISGRAPADLDEASSYAVHSSEFARHFVRPFRSLEFRASDAAAAAPPQSALEARLAALKAAPAASARPRQARTRKRKRKRKNYGSGGVSSCVPVIICPDAF